MRMTPRTPKAGSTRVSRWMTGGAVGLGVPEEVEAVAVLDEGMVLVGRDVGAARVICSDVWMVVGRMV